MYIYRSSATKTQISIDGTVKDLLTFLQHFPPTHFHRFCSKMSDPQLRCGYFLFLETWYRYDLTWLQQLRKPATKKFIHVSLLLHCTIMWIQFANQEICSSNVSVMKPTLSDSTSGRFYNLYKCYFNNKKCKCLHSSYTSTRYLTMLVCCFKNSCQNQFKFLYVLFSFIFVWDFLLTCALNLSVDYISFPTISNKLQ